MTVESLLVLHNVSKKRNFGEILRSAAAMGVSEVAIVGAQKLASHGAHGTAGHLRFVHFQRLADCVEYLRNVRKATLCGIEITPDAQPVHRHPFRGTTAFILGNEGQGMTDAQMSVCDHFVYIPQHSAATASLNVNAACAVVLHHFAIWAAMPEAAKEGFKFVCGTPGSSQPHSGIGLRHMRTLGPDGAVLSKQLADSSASSGEEDGGRLIELGLSWESESAAAES